MNINALENAQVMTSLVDYTKLGINGIKRKEFLLGSSWVNGEWLDSPVTIDVNDPATGQLICSISSFGSDAVDEAVDAAVRAFPVWANYLPRQRGNLLRKWAALMREHQEDLALLITLEQGKPLDESRGEIEYGAGFIEWFAGEAERLYGETLPSHKPGRSLSVVIQPVGVAACITPWNFPSAMIARKAGAALAVGCTMIVKPAPETPLSALALARLAEEAGIPSGVLQVIVGEAAPLSRRLLERKEVRAFSFTGSTEVGRLLLGQAAATVKKVSLELGGNAPFIIFDDVSLDKAVEGCMAAKFATSGQDCLAANRIYVQRGIYKEFIERFAIKVSELRVGHGLENGVTIGPMTRPSVAEKCRRLIADAIEKGARVITKHSGRSTGMFVSPAVLVDVTEGMSIATEEIFGPLAAILPFDDEGEVVNRANNTEMGLAAYVFTNDLARSSRIVERLEYGMVAVNTASFTGPPIPFGGWKQSGLGREGSRHGTAEYTEMKYICASLGS